MKKQIDETGKSAAWIARFGREAMALKEREYASRLALHEALSPSEKTRRERSMDHSDDHSAGTCSVDDNN